MAVTKGNPQQGLMGATIGFFAGFAAVALFGPTAKNFQEVMGLDPMLLAFLVAMPSLSGSLLRIPFAAWVDSTGGRKPFLVLLILSILGMLGLFLVIQFLYPDNLEGTYPLLLLLAVLSGCGIATFSVGISQVSYWYPQKAQGKALGIYAGAGNLAPGIFTFILPVALASIGLAWAYMAWLLFLIAGTVLYFLCGRNAWYFQLRQAGVAPEDAKEQARAQGQELFPRGSTIDSLRNSARVWKTWPLVGIYFTTFGGFLALTGWFPTYWREYFSLELSTAGALAGTFAVLASLMRVAGGTICDRLGGEKSALISLVVTGVGALMIALSGSLALSVVGVLVMATGMGVCNAAVFKLVPQEVPEAVGGAAGWVGGLGAFGGFAIPPLMATFVKIMGVAGYAAGFLVFLLLSVVSLLLVWMLRRGRVVQRNMRAREAAVTQA